MQKLLIVIFHKTAEATGEFIGNKIAEKIVKPKPVSDANLRKGWGNNSFTREKTGTMKQIKTSITKSNTVTYVNY